jgi:hypothetical protein
MKIGNQEIHPEQAHAGNKILSHFNIGRKEPKDMQKFVYDHSILDNCMEGLLSGNLPDPMKIGEVTIHPEQVHAGNAIMECIKGGKKFPLLISQPQQGKTSVGIHVGKNIIDSAKASGIKFRVIWLVHLSDTSVLEQTEDRINMAWLNHDVEVYHRGNLHHFEFDGSVQQTLIVLDECHYAIDKDSPIDRFLMMHGVDYGTSCPEDVHVLSISATPYAHSIHEENNKGLEGSFITIPLPLSQEYYSLRHMVEADRMEQSEPIIIRNKVTPFCKKIMGRFEDDCEKFGNGYFVIRLNKDSRQKILKEWVEENHRDVDVLSFSSLPEPENEEVAKLDKRLSYAPGKPTIILIRGAQRAGKTLSTTRHIRAWYEPSNSKMDAAMQAIGRVLGHPSSMPDKHSKFDDDFPVYCNSEDIDDALEYYDGIYKDDPTKIIPNGIRNKSSQGRKIVYDYEQLVFSNCPSVDEVNAECLRLGISGDLSKKGITRHTVSENNWSSISRALQNNTGYQQSTPENYLAFHVDAANENFFGDWEQLQNEKPHMIGKWVVALHKESGKRVQRDFNNLISKKTIFAQ